MKDEYEQIDFREPLANDFVKIKSGIFRCADIITSPNCQAIFSKKQRSK